MIETLMIDRGPLVAMRVTGKLTHEDYRSRIIPRVQRALAEHDRLRFVGVLGAEYDGITPGALWDELKFDVAHRKDFERVAIVTDNGLVRAAVKLSSPFFRGEVRLYRLAELAEAEAWAQEGMGEASGAEA